MEGQLPKYLALAELLVREVAAGRLADGARLPPERDMAKSLDVAVGTLRKALDVLVDRGMVERRQGSGNYIIAKADTGAVYAFFRLELLEGGGLPSAQVVSLGPGPETVELGPSMQLRRVRLLDDRPVAIEEILIKGSRVPGITQADLSVSLYLTYREQFGFYVSRIEDRIGCDVFPEWSPIKADAAGYVQRQGWAADGDLVETSQTWFDPQACRYVSRLT